MSIFRQTKMPNHYNLSQPLVLDGDTCGDCKRLPRYAETYEGGWCRRTTDVVWTWSRQANSCPFFDRAARRKKMEKVDKIE